MGDPLVDHLRTCCVQVMGARPGCGFFVTPNLLVTCAHVVGRDVTEGAPVPLRRWENGRVCNLDPATVVKMFSDDDLALLRTVADKGTFAPLSKEVRTGHVLIALGYPRQEDRELFDQFEARYEGQTQFLDASGRAGVEAKFTAGQVEPGYSGGPLLNLQTGRVMGVVVATRDQRSNLGGWAIEIPVLEKRLEEQGIQLPPVDPQWTDAEAKQRAGAEEGGFTPAQIHALRELLQADNPAQTRVEELSRALGKNQNAIRFALHSLGEHEAELPDETLPIKLIESIQAFETQRADLAVLQSDDTEIMARFDVARLALEEEIPNVQVADAAFEDASELALARARAAEALETKAREIREQGLLEAAEACALRGQLAMARFRYLDAAGHFKRAADLAPASRAVEGADYLTRYADALYRQGTERGNNEALTQSIDIFYTLLASYPRGSAALNWARTQNNLGLALRRLGEREAGTTRLEEAVQAYRAALEERTRERVPLDWAMTQNNLGNVLLTLGEREAGTTRLEEAVQAYRAALEERTRERVPLDWAMTQNNLGNALQRLGEREAGTTRLEEAVQAHRAALEEYTRKRVPLNWASTQNNLGLALQTLGQREAGTTRLEEAVQAYRAALEERTRERVPLDWAMTQNNLGLALQTLGQREAGTTRLEEAVQAYRAALEEYTRERVPLNWAMTQNNLGNALRMLGEREAGTTRLEEAVQAYRAALEEYTRERVPLNWAMTQNNLGSTLTRLGEREAGTTRLEEAVQAYRAALEERTRERVPLDWAMTQNNLGLALRMLGEREAGTTRLEEAVQAYRAALEEHTRERVPLDWAMTQNNLGSALLPLGEREAGTTRLEEAVQAYRAALEERTRERVPLDWAMTQNNLGNALQRLGEEKKEVALIYEALESHSAAWAMFTRFNAYYASVAARNVQGDMEVLKRAFPLAIFQDCLVRYRQVFARMNLL